MTGTDESAADTAGDDGRYLYCVVDADAAPGVETGTPLGTDGVDGAEPYLVVTDGLGAVVQRRSEPYESGDEATVKRWLLQHQRVVDAATERFETPLPVRFDTVLRGDDDRIAEWLRREAGDLRPPLERFAGRSEYRIEVTCDADRFATDATASDDRLDEINAERAEADEGTAFLKSKQAERRERTLVGDRWRELAAELGEFLRAHATDVEDVDRSVSTLDAEGRSDGADFETTFAVLADEDAAATIGDRLDQTAARPGVEVRYTGPWAPYTFAPAMGSDE